MKNYYIIAKSKIRPYLKYLIIKSQEIVKHIVHIINQLPPITLENSLNEKIMNLILLGNTNQTQLTGKNLFNKDGDIQLNKRLSQVGGAINDNGYFVSDWIPITELKYYTKNSPLANAYHRICYYSDTSQSAFILASEENTSLAPEGALYLRIAGNLTELSTTQIEEGQTVTDFEPYCGGISSPNPSYPQNIDVVTGNNTITISDGINTESYSLNLGDIELCKIGEYQDSIYKENDKWYLLKVFNKKVLDENISIGYSQQTNNVFYGSTFITDMAISDNIPFCNFYKGENNIHNARTS